MMANFGDINENNQSPLSKVEENTIPGHNKIIGIHELNRVTSAYIDYLLNSYIDLLLSMDSKVKLCEWIDLIFDNKHLTKVKLIIENGETLDDSKQDLVTYIVNEFIFETYKRYSIQNNNNNPLDLTPWDFSMTRNAMLTNLFGPGSTAIFLTVVIQSVNENMARKYVHTVSQDFAFGLLSILNTYQEYKFLVNGTYLTLSDLKHRYESKIEILTFYIRQNYPMENMYLIVQK